MHLRLVPPSEPTGKQAVIERIKQRTMREPGMLQCPKCGGRDTMTIRNGDRINENGRHVPGTVTHQHECPHCWKKGIRSDMLPEPPKPAT
jgi:Zn finger protein HypA/HybF involved in hydrogenase expression